MAWIINVSLCCINTIFFILLSQEGDSWEIIEGLKIGQTSVQKPEKHEGFMLKKRKWPLKGWHKVSFLSWNEKGLTIVLKNTIKSFYS